MARPESVRARRAGLVAWGAAVVAAVVGVGATAATVGAEGGGAAPGRAAEPDGLVASPEPGWPQWRGPRRDGRSDEKGLLQAWPEGGPRLLWTATGLGRGWSSPIIVRDTLWITGDVGEDLRVFALDLAGKPRWQAGNGAAWKGPYPGARASCVYSEGHIYHMNAHGRAACLEARTGREVWAVDVLDRFGGRNLTWAISECLLVDGPRVLVTPGGSRAFLAALDKRTGETVWASEPLDEPHVQRTGYASPILVRFGGRRLAVTLALRAMVAVDADTGRLQWAFPKRSRYDACCATPVWWAGHVFYTIPSGSGGVMLRLLAGGEKVGVEPAWECAMDNISGGAVAVDGFLYGSGEKNAGWVCLDARTGEVKYDSRDLEQGSVLYADGRLTCLGERGHVRLVRPDPAGFDVVGAMDLGPLDPKRRDAWAHPVVLDGRLYLRYHDTLYCYDVRRPG